jgi:hypothetical protein
VNNCVSINLSDQRGTVNKLLLNEIKKNGIWLNDVVATREKAAPARVSQKHFRDIRVFTVFISYY